MTSDVHGDHDFDVVGTQLPTDFQTPIHTRTFDERVTQVQAAVAQAQRKNEPGLRYDAGKLRYDLIPADALAALAEVYTKGAAKYADRNWEKGMTWGRCFGSLMRHSWKWWAREDYDQETGCHHMAMAAWNCFALFCYATRPTGEDDRP